MANLGGTSVGGGGSLRLSTGSVPDYAGGAGGYSPGAMYGALLPYISTMLQQKADRGALENKRLRYEVGQEVNPKMGATDLSAISMAKMREAEEAARIRANLTSPRQKTIYGPGYTGKVNDTDSYSGVERQAWLPQSSRLEDPDERIRAMQEAAMEGADASLYSDEARRKQMESGRF